MNRRVLQRSVVFLVASLLLAAPGLAADCGGGVPCSCGDLVTADHTLNCGVDPITETTCSGDGLLVDRNVSLNLGHCTLRGTSIGSAIRLGNAASVEGGRIVGFNTGVSRLPDSDPNKVRLLRITDTAGTAISLTGGRLIERNMIERSGGFGILVDSIVAVVRQNRVEDSADCGLVVVGGGALVDRNIVLRAEVCGIRISGFRHVVTRNQVKSTQSGPGFLFRLVDENRVVLNLSMGAQDPGGTGRASGMLLESASQGNVFERNTSSNNTGFGIDARVGLPNTFDRNRCDRNELGDSAVPGHCD